VLGFEEDRGGYMSSLAGRADSWEWAWTENQSSRHLGALRISLN